MLDRIVLVELLANYRMVRNNETCGSRVIYVPPHSFLMYGKEPYDLLTENQNKGDSFGYGEIIHNERDVYKCVIINKDFYYEIYTEKKKQEDDYESESDDKDMKPSKCKISLDKFIEQDRIWATKCGHLCRCIRVEKYESDKWHDKIHKLYEHIDKRFKYEK